jgi:hypothetical protein
MRQRLPKRARPRPILQRMTRSAQRWLERAQSVAATDMIGMFDERRQFQVAPP